MADVINFPNITTSASSKVEAEIFADLVSGNKPKIGEDCRFTLPDGPVHGTLTALIDEDGEHTEDFDVAHLMIVAFPDNEGFTVIPLGPRAHTFSLSVSA